MSKTNRTSSEAIRDRTALLLSRAHQQWDLKQLRSAFRLFLAAAKLGDVTAQLNLGYFYDVGVGVSRNRNKAVAWYKQAYRQGHGSAASNLGTIFRDEGDDGEALKWFKRAIEHRDFEANLEIAKIYLRRENQAAKAVPYLKELLLKARKGLNVSEAVAVEARKLMNNFGK
jgi:TPR repeat protein